MFSRATRSVTFRLKVGLRVVIPLLLTGAACAQTITRAGNPVSYFAVTLGTQQCSYWVKGEQPGMSEIAMYQNGAFVPGSVVLFPPPAPGTNIFPCPAPLDRFNVAVSATGVLTGSIIPLVTPPPPTQTYSEVLLQGHGDGVTRTFILVTMPATPLLKVSVNGQNTTAFTFDGKLTITFATAPPQGAEILALYR